MQLVIGILMVASAIIGHFSLTVWLFNRLHALGWPRRVIKSLEKGLLLAALAILLCLLFASQNSIAHGYAVFCCFVAIAAIPLWLVPKLRETTSDVLVSNDTTTIDVAQRLGFRPVHGPETELLATIPGNELLKIAVPRKTLRIAGLPLELDGLTIAHLSDLHMTGQLGREYYDIVVDETNALTPDLVVITGDILEKKACLPWIAATLGRLQARHGKFFILGNHEQRLRDIDALRRELVAADITDLGGKHESLTLRGVELFIAGTERPWFGSNPPTPHFALRTPHFSILLSHTPDQLPFARRHQFQLMLAGHNHGGQIRLPYLGALITPSHYGSRYAGGLYFEPPTLLHVSRGLAGIHPIRLNCPPELPLLTLKAA